MRRLLREILEQRKRISGILDRMKQIQRYRSIPYLKGSRIIDFEASSRDEEVE